MARRRKKSEDERFEEDFVPLNPKNIKISTEVVEEDQKLETVEKKGKKKRKKTKKSTKRKTKKKSFEPEDEIFKSVDRSKGSYTLIITEKPQAASKIASALGRSKKVSLDGASYHEVIRDGKKLIVAAAAGHLFGLAQKTKGQSPVFDLEWVPSYKKKASFTKKFYDILKKLNRNAKDFIVATDYDIEGEVIGWNILRFICGEEDARRMKYSTLTTSELENAYNNLMSTIDWGQAIAGETRHYLDWMYGINLSRALMNSLSKAGGFKIMSIGRVQGPALRLVVDKELEIRKFKPTPFWQVYITAADIELKYNKDITNKKELSKFEELNGKLALLITKKTEEKILPPAPFDLTTLQTEAYKYFKLTPSKTLQIAQQLYLAGLISYPRTSSQKIPESINPKSILKKLEKSFSFTKNITRDKPIEGKKSDPAHPSIYPTGEEGELSGDNKKVYELIVKRFVSCFCKDTEVLNKTIIAEVDGLKFSTKGIEIKEEGWMKVYPAKLQERKLEDVEGEHEITNVKIDKKETQPPRRYTPASLVSELSKRNLGTKATRAMIIETLYDRDYVRDQSVKATDLGISLIETLKHYSPIIVDEKLTREFEREMESIVTAKKDLKKKEENIINDAKNSITKIMDDIKKNQDKIGTELLEVIKEQRNKEREESAIMVCPVCKKGNLRILYNKGARRYFVACSAYPECKTTYTLPPYGMMKKTDKVCEECEWPKLMALQRGKRPWEFCFNPDCPTRKKQSNQNKNNNKEINNS